jgi:hypothetical protein
MMHPGCELRWAGDGVGWGVFARERLPRGTITWARDPLDQLLAPSLVAALPEPLREPVELYSYLLPDGTYVLCWDIGKYVNHSCAPTSRGLGADCEIAVRDVAPGEQLSSDYAELNIVGGFTCRCGAPTCRKLVHADDLLRYGDAWDAEVRAAIPDVLLVEQPLWALLPAPDELRAAAEGRAPVTTRASYRFPGAGR